jgi:hypothetical protein
VVSPELPPELPLLSVLSLVSSPEDEHPEPPHLVSQASIEPSEQQSPWQEECTEHQFEELESQDADLQEIHFPQEL